MTRIDLPAIAFRVLICLLYGFLLLPVVAVSAWCPPCTRRKLTRFIVTPASR